MKHLFKTILLAIFGLQMMYSQMGWEYYTKIDDMTGKKIYYAYTYSKNELYFDFPYDGGTLFQLWVRKDPELGTDVFITSYKTKCNFATHLEYFILRFDKEPIFKLKILGTDSGDNSTVFFEDPTFLIKKMKQKKRILKIKAVFYNDGYHTIKFDLDSLKWNH